MAKHLETCHAEAKARMESLLLRLSEHGTSEGTIEKIRNDAPALVEAANLGQTPSGDAVPDGKVGKEMRRSYLDARKLDLDHRCKQLPRDDARRQAYLNCDRYSASILLMPSDDIAFADMEFRVAVCTQLGLPSPLTVDLIGNEIQNNHPRIHWQVDLYGRNLTNAHGWSGDERHKRAHDETERAVVEELREGGFQASNGYSNMVSSLISLLPERERSKMSQLADSRQRHNIVPDINVNLSSGDKLAGFEGHGRLWCELKLVAARRYYEQGSSSRNNAVRARGLSLEDDYLQHAEKLDRAYFSTPRGDLGPVARAFLSVGFVGIVGGRYGELSRPLSALLGEAGKQQAARWSALTHLPLERCEAVATRRARTVVSLTLQRCHARNAIDAEGHTREGAGLAPKRCRRVFETSCTHQAARRAETRSYTSAGFGNPPRH